MDSLSLVVAFLAAGGVAAFFLMREKGLRETLEQAVRERFEAEKQAELAMQKLATSELRVKDWETQREESVKHAKAAILEAGGQMSSKLLEDHKREQETFRKEQQERQKNLQESLMKEMHGVAQIVATMREQTQQTQGRMETVWRAIASPSGAGQLAEIGLENTLKNMGLERDRDFKMQYGVTDKETGSRLRPDAVIFLPQDMVIVVDSKASKFVLEVAEAEDEILATEARERLKRTMQQHMRDLGNKDYTSAVLNSFREKGKGSDIRVLLNVMYLPSDAALEHLKKADSEIMDRAEKAGIILASPASLHGLLSLAKLQIANAKQAENTEQIVASVEKLLESTALLITYAEKIGKGLKSASDAFNEMAVSVNKRLLPRMQQIMKMGVSLPKNKPLPAPILTYDMRRMDDAHTFEEALELAAEETVKMLES